MTKQEMKERVETRIKTMLPGEWYTFYLEGSFFDVCKTKDNTYLMCSDELLSDLLDIKEYTKQELINAMINEIERN